MAEAMERSSNLVSDSKRERSSSREDILDSERSYRANIEIIEIFYHFYFDIPHEYLSLFLFHSFLFLLFFIHLFLFPYFFMFFSVFLFFPMIFSIRFPIYACSYQKLY